MLKYKQSQLRHWIVSDVCMSEHNVHVHLGKKRSSKIKLRYMFLGQRKEREKLKRSIKIGQKIKFGNHGKVTKRREQCLFLTCFMSYLSHFWRRWNFGHCPLTYFPVKILIFRGKILKKKKNCRKFWQNFQNPRQFCSPTMTSVNIRKLIVATKSWIWRHLWPNYDTQDFKSLTQCVKMLGERVLQVWRWYLQRFRRYRKKTRGGARNSPPPPVGRKCQCTPAKINRSSGYVCFTFRLRFGQCVPDWPMLYGFRTTNVNPLGQYSPPPATLKMQAYGVDSLITKMLFIFTYLCLESLSSVN